MQSASQRFSTYPVPASLGAKIGGRGWCVLFIALLLGYALVIATSAHPPILQDYPDWVYQGVMFGKLLAGHAPTGYVLKHYPVPNSLTTIGVGLLSLAMGWAAAAKVWLLLVLAALGTAAWVFMRRLGIRTYAVLPIYATALIVGLDLWNGSINFLLSMAFFLLILTHLLGPKQSEGVLAVLLLLCFFTHMLPCGAGLLALAALALQERSGRRILPALPTLLCVAWYAMKRDRGVEAQPASHLLPALLAAAMVLLWMARQDKGKDTLPKVHLASLVWPPAFSGPVMLGFSKVINLTGWIGPLNVLTAGLFPDRVLWPIGVFLSFSVAGACAAVLGLVLLCLCCLRVCRDDSTRRFLGGTALAFGAMFLVTPSDALGVTGIDSRLLHLGLAVGIGLLGLFPGRRLNALAALAVLIGFVNLYQFAAVQRRPGTVSVGYEHHLLVGVDPVAPAIRSPYYDSLSKGQFNRVIFSTAMFQKLP